MKYILTTENLTKTYGQKDAAKDINIHIREGSIYGLIGRNGAGKTTVMRMISGLSKPTSGTYQMYGEHKFGVGVLIESPGIYPNMSAQENLRLKCIGMGCYTKEYVQQLLETVGLENTGKKNAGSFSLGMRQRLGIALALVGDPKMIVLDEPINGLDPIGVVEIRELIKRLCDEKGMTILISSHNLPELYQCATDYIIIDHGQIKEQITLEELEEKCKHYLRIETPDAPKLAQVLESKLGTTNFKVMADGSVQLYDFTDEKEKVTDVLFENGVKTTGFSLMGETLENYFISAVGR